MPKPKSSSAYTPPSKTQHTSNPSISSLASFSHASDLRRDSSASPFTPAPSISGPIPALPQRHHHQPSRENSLRDRDRDPTRQPSTSSQYNPYTSLPTSHSISESQNTTSIPPSLQMSNNIGSSNVPVMSPIPRSSSSASHMSIKSTSSGGSFRRGSFASIRTNDPLPPLPNQPTSMRSSLYSVSDDSHNLSSTKSDKSATKFTLERPADDAIVEQMFNDLIVSLFSLFLKSSF